MTAALALALSLAVALAAWRLHAVTAGGAAAATLVGTAVLWPTGWPGAAVLGAFFVPSTLAGRWGARRSTASDARGERRDAVQVLANGGAAAVGAWAERYAQGLGFWMVTTSLAAAAADTWATAAGAYSRRDPRLLLSGTTVPRGSSGGVSVKGTLGGVLGALVVSAAAALVGPGGPLWLAGVIVGTGGMLLDSLLGEVVQARFHCPRCRAASERRVHRCGQPTERVGGWAWLDNDGVNAVTTIAAALAGLLWFR